MKMRVVLVAPSGILSIFMLAGYFKQLGEFLLEFCP